jgi:hypothetical protein
MTWAIAAPLGVAFVGLWYLSIRVAFRIGLIKAYRCAYDLCEEVAEDISKRQRMAGVDSRVVLVSLADRFARLEDHVRDPRVRHPSAVHG